LWERSLLPAAYETDDDANHDQRGNGCDRRERGWVVQI
jgi:hypothetical protein